MKPTKTALAATLLILAGCSNDSEEDKKAAAEAGVAEADVLRYSLLLGRERYWRDHIFEQRLTRAELRGIKEELKRLNDRLDAED